MVQRAADGVLDFVALELLDQAGRETGSGNGELAGWEVVMRYTFIANCPLADQRVTDRTEALQAAGSANGDEPAVPSAISSSNSAAAAGDPIPNPPNTPTRWSVADRVTSPR